MESLSLGNDGAHRAVGGVRCRNLVGLFLLNLPQHCVEAPTPIRHSVSVFPVDGKQASSQQLEITVLRAFVL